MPVTLPIPPADIVPLPLPVGACKTLLLVSFGMHILAVNLGVGGSILSLVLARLGRKSPAYLAIAKAVAPILPPAVTFAITLGVAPLLFAQVLYGRFLYTSSILMAIPWMSFIVALIAGYALLYRHTRLLKGGVLSLPTAIVSTLLFLWIGFLWTNNVTLMLQPDRWAALAAAAPHGGVLNLADPAVLPRFLHMALAMTATAALFLGTAAALFDVPFDRDLGRRFGLRIFAILTGIQLLVGPIVLLLQRADVRAALLGGSPRGTAAIAVAVPAAIAAIVTALRGADPRTGRKGALVPFVLIHATIAAMVVLRDEVRDRSLLSAGFHVERSPVAVDVFAAVLFAGSALLLLLGLRAILGWLRSGRRPQEAIHGS